MQRDDLIKLSKKRAESQRREFAPSESNFRLVPVGGLSIRPPMWLIRDFVEKDSIFLCFGAPGCGKSFLGIDIAACIATGADFHGLPVTPGPVVYIAGEGQNGLGRRFKAWSIRRGIDLKTAPLLVSTMPAALCDANQVQHVASVIDDASAEYGPPVLIVIDTLARNFGPGDENSTQDMTKFVAACDTLRSKHRAGVLVVHHNGHADRFRARGSAALKGALDAEFRLDKDAAGICRLESTKMKDFKTPEPLAFIIRSVELSITEEDGTPVTSAVLEDAEYDAAAAPEGNKGQGKWQKIALAALANLYDEHQKRLESGGFNSDSARVSLEDWRVACRSRRMSRQTFAKVKASLSQLGLISIEHDFVKIVASVPLSPV